MYPFELIVLSYHKFSEQPLPYEFSRTYEQFWHDIRKKVYDMITIDDGMKSIIHACEMMKEINIRAKLFITTGLIEREGYCTWDDLKRLSQSHDIESHGHIHDRHSWLSPAEIRASIEMSCDLIEQNIGRRPRFFVAPYNNYSPIVDRMVLDCGLISIKNRIEILNTTV